MFLSIEMFLFSDSLTIDLLWEQNQFTAHNVWSVKTCNIKRCGHFYVYSNMNLSSKLIALKYWFRSMEVIMNVLFMKRLHKWLINNYCHGINYHITIFKTLNLALWIRFSNLEGPSIWGSYEKHLPWHQLLWIFHSSPRPVSALSLSQGIMMTWQRVLRSNKQDHMCVSSSMRQVGQQKKVNKEIKEIDKTQIQ